MYSPTIKSLSVLAFCMLVSACSSSSDQAELREYIEEVKARPPGMIEPMPTFRPYEAFVYGAAATRSPFDPPVEEKQRVLAEADVNIEPDLMREKEFLETFDLGSLRMVGTMEMHGTLWALIKDPNGGIHRVTTGNYLGKDHGHIIETSRTQLDVVEIVSNGLDGWVERPRVLKLSEKEN
jgi:type IV pilus assembly protein PilP